MSEDRLERALQEMKDEDVDSGTLETARARVWEKMSNAGRATCAEFRQDLRAYLGKELGDSRRILVEDHLSRCPGCRARIAEMKGERSIVAMPEGLRRRSLGEGASSSRWVQWGVLAAAAVVLFAFAYLGRNAIDALLGPGGARATVVSADGGLYRLVSGSLEAGAAIGERESVRTGPGAHAVLRLADGLTVDVNERTELFVTAAWSGQAIHLQRGDIIVKAAKQRRGRLQVLTRDSIASVKGTVFAVSAGMGGSVVSVVEGSVAVNQPHKQVVLSPGQQAASIPALASSVASAVAWSPEAESYLELLASFVKIERELAKFPAELRTNSALLPNLPAEAIVYGAVPNPGVTIGRALALAEEQSAQNAAFAAWWNSETGQQLKQMVDRVQSVNPLLGDEIVFCASIASGLNDPVPMVMARVNPGKRTELASALEKLFADAGEAPGSYSVSDDLVVVSESPSSLAWLLAHLGQGAGSPFATAISERYRRGVGWLIALDAAPVLKEASGGDTPPIELAGMVGMKYLFLEQRAPAGAEENEVTVAFQGTRTGMGSWLADSGSGGAAEYLPVDALVAGYVSTREPLQLFEELTAQITKLEPDFSRGLAEMDEKLGTGFVQNLTAAVGTESAVAVTGLSTSGPTWLMTTVANNPSVIDSSLKKLVETFNAELGPDQQNQRIVFTQESVSGRTWSTMAPGGLPLRITWTYDRGYMVAASDRAVAERAIATRNGGSPLVWSPEFLGQLPSSAGLHPSAFGWVNAKGALDILSALAPSPALRELVAARDPMLVVFNGTPEQIRAASRYSYLRVDHGRDADSEPRPCDRSTVVRGSHANDGRARSALNNIPVVELDNLKVTLGRREILHGITCRLGVSGTGKAVGLLGPNGAGKSTLILTLLGFLRPSAGRARILGLDCRRNMGEARSRIGYMPENDSFVGEMTAVTFVRQMAELSGLPPKAALEKAHEVLFHVGLGEARYRELRTYSYGMKQMAKLAQAIVHGPELVVLDEPTNGLDPAARRRMLKLIVDMKEEQGMNILVCSHLLRDIEQVCDEAVILKDGLIVHQCNLEEERRSNRHFVELEVTGDDRHLRTALPEIGAEGVSEGAGRWRIVLPAGVEVEAVWALAARQNLLVRKLTHRRDTLEEIFLKAMGHLSHTPGEATSHGSS